MTNRMSPRADTLALALLVSTACLPYGSPTHRPPAVLQPAATPLGNRIHRGAPKALNLLGLMRRGAQRPTRPTGPVRLPQLPRG
jgi:hypothetical protein